MTKKEFRDMAFNTDCREEFINCCKQLEHNHGLIVDLLPSRIYNVSLEVLEAFEPLLAVATTEGDDYLVRMAMKSTEQLLHGDVKCDVWCIYFRDYGFEELSDNDFSRLYEDMSSLMGSIGVFDASDDEDDEEEECDEYDDYWADFDEEDEPEEVTPVVHQPEKSKGLKLIFK